MTLNRAKQTLIDQLEIEYLNVPQEPAFLKVSTRASQKAWWMAIWKVQQMATLRVLLMEDWMDLWRAFLKGLLMEKMTVTSMAFSKEN